MGLKNDPSSGKFLTAKTAKERKEIFTAEATERNGQGLSIPVRNSDPPIRHKPFLRPQRESFAFLVPDLRGSVDFSASVNGKILTAKTAKERKEIFTAEATEKNGQGLAIPVRNSDPPIRHEPFLRPQRESFAFLVPDLRRSADFSALIGGKFLTAKTAKERKEIFTTEATERNGQGLQSLSGTPIHPFATSLF